MDPTKRILELAREGLSDADIAKRLEKEGIRNAKGGTFDRNSVHSRRLRAGNNSDITETSDTSRETSEESAISEKTKPFPEEWKVEIVGIVRQEIQAMMKDQMAPPLSIENVEPPPSPGKEKGEYDRPVGKVKRTKIAGTIYQPIHEAFEKWRKGRGMSLSVALDTALWHFLGKPPIASETSEESDE